MSKITVTTYPLEISLFKGMSKIYSKRKENVVKRMSGTKYSRSFSPILVKMLKTFNMQVKLAFFKYSGNEITKLAGPSLLQFPFSFLHF